MQVLNLAQGSKPAALNAGDAAAQGEMRAYLDADVIVSPALMGQLVAALLRDAPTYASGTPLIPKPEIMDQPRLCPVLAETALCPKRGPRFWSVRGERAGRTRWGEFPGIISDDTFVRLHFAPGERIGCPATYQWPMIEGFGPLVGVRRRQDAGVRELTMLHPGFAGE